MELTIITPKKKETLSVTWIEAQTVVGNRVIQDGHAPLLIILQPDQPFIFMLPDGVQQTITVAGGTLEVSRERALLLLHEE